MKYEILTSKTDQELSIKVNRYLSKGWELKGDLIVNEKFHQVITKGERYEGAIQKK